LYSIRDARRQYRLTWLLLLLPPPLLLLEEVEEEDEEDEDEEEEESSLSIQGKSPSGCGTTLLSTVPALPPVALPPSERPMFWPSATVMAALLASSAGSARERKACLVAMRNHLRKKLVSSRKDSDRVIVSKARPRSDDVLLASFAAERPL